MKLFPGARRLKKQDVDDLQREIPCRDVIADKLGKRTTHGTIEDIENAAFPWLRERRKRRPQQQD